MQGVHQETPQRPALYTPYTYGHSPLLKLSPPLQQLGSLSVYRFRGSEIIVSQTLVGAVLSTGPQPISEVRAVMSASCCPRFTCLLFTSARFLSQPAPRSPLITSYIVLRIYRPSSLAKWPESHTSAMHWILSVLRSNPFVLSPTPASSPSPVFLVYSLTCLSFFVSLSLFKQVTQDIISCCRGLSHYYYFIGISHRPLWLAGFNSGISHVNRLPTFLEYRLSPPWTGRSYIQTHNNRPASHFQLDSRPPSGRESAQHPLHP
ncbi:hypothetical protein SODALDRAFT_21530 [Sodiomyces alkalinus F11]|uniref:Uncharacterized protein n=1 Tax=Sodiomyces alkalinus (strain CBS 110278 / VKM F-3762 / F11) TaxID=1314773 RepID=A0A3N2Q7R7_SODAK|nr:hypothetical protein SODALDRAFT_21530 [Sodiomyces alkalinus F11]ROT42708.1 hypothetical protein SODALDRAFT_21530 [Sodiomyces alkalinus F11]